MSAAVCGCSGGGSSLTNLPPASSAKAAEATSASSGAAPVTDASLTVARKRKDSSSVVGLTDDFSSDPVGAPAAGWNVISGTWSVCASGSVHAYCQTSTNTGESLNGATWWTDYTVNALVADSNTAYGGAGIIGRASSSSQYYLFELRSQINGSKPYWYLLKKSAGPTTILASGPLQAPDSNPNYALRLAFAGSQITASIAFSGGSTYQSLCTVTDSSYPAGQVGLYSWISAARSFQNVVVTVAGATLPSESATAAATFVDSIGMNGHFESPFYYNNAAQVRSLIGNLGAHHYRVSAANILAGTGYAATLADLYTSFGIKFDVLSDLLTSPASVTVAVGRLPAGSVDAIEGPNEADSPSQGPAYDPAFATDVPAYMQSLYPTLKSTAATSSATVIGPAFANYTSYAAIGNISGYVDAGNMHDYFAGFNPGTAGWGGSGFSFAPGLNYGSIDWNVAASAQATGSKPVIATETGYYTAPIHGGLPFDVQAKYIPRLYLEQFRHHVLRTYLYQLVGYDTTTSDGSLDIVSPAIVPSPAYNALAGMITLLTDGTATGTPRSYNWGLTGQTTNVDHLLLHKADGTLIIPLWLEVPSFDPNANGGIGAPLSIPTQAVTVTLPPGTSNVVAWTCNPETGKWSSQPVAVTNGSFAWNVSDAVSLLLVGPS